MSLRKRLKDAARAFREGLHPIIFDPGPLKFERTELQTTKVALTFHRSRLYAMESDEGIRERMAEQIGRRLLMQKLIKITTTVEPDPFDDKQVYTAEVRVVIPPEEADR